jgi:hypothetical protein
MYVQSPLTESVPYFIHPKPSGTKFSVGNATIIKTGASSTGQFLFSDFPYAPTYTTGGNPVKNFVWGSNTPHPSDVQIAYDTGATMGVWMDTTVEISSTGNYAKSAETSTNYLLEYAKRGFTSHGEGQMFGYATCHWIRACLPTEYVGSACSASLSGVTYYGYCFRSDTGSLECGHTTALDNEYGESPITLGMPVGSPETHPVLGATVPTLVEETGLVPSSTYATQDLAGSPSVTAAHRCMTGAPAKSLGYFTYKRPKIGGCMVPGDPSFDPIAEINVMDYCTGTDKYGTTGCMLPGALNYNPLAISQWPADVCKWPTKGCTNSFALNYNPLATISDDALFPCRLPVLGCTIAAATYNVGSSATTPGYKSLYYAFAGTGKGGAGGPTRGPVSETVYNGPAVISTAPGANVIGPGSCTVAIEGCMDSTAVNYDPLATINSYTWCVPLVSGCMMPDVATAKTGSYSNPQATMASNTLVIPGGVVDGLSHYYYANVTKHVDKECKILRYGCTDWMFLNYDSLATVQTYCYPKVLGCLNRMAFNYGCINRRDYYAPCTLPETERVTVHKALLCRFSYPPPTPPSPPPPPAPPANEFQIDYSTTMEAQFLDTSANILAQEEPMKDAFKDFASLPATTVVDFALSRRRRRSLEEIEAVVAPHRRNLVRRSLQVDPNAQEINVIMTAPVESEAAAAAATSALAATVGNSIDSMQAAFGDSLGLTVTATPKIEVGVKATPVDYAPPFPPPDDSAAGSTVVIIVVVVVVVLILFVAGGFMFMRARKKSVYPA